MSVRKDSLKHKLVIKPLKSIPKLPENFEDVSWKKLKESINAVFLKIATDISKEELYRCVEDLCLHKLSSKLYSNLKEELNSQIQNVILNMLREEMLDPMTFLKHVDDAWKQFVEQILIIRNIFLYLDRTYALQTVGVKPIWDIGLSLFKSHLTNYSNVVQRIIISLLHAIEIERRGQLSNRESMRRLVGMLSSLGLYITRFEGPFLQDSIRFFKAEGQLLMESSSPSVFMQAVDERLGEVNDMISAYLENATRTPLIQVIENQMLSPHVTIIVEKGLLPILNHILLPKQSQTFVSSSSNGLQNSSSTSAAISTTINSTILRDCQIDNKLLDLRRMYVLLDRVNSLDILKREFTNFLRNIGEAIVSNEGEREKTMIDELLSLQENLELILHYCFANQDDFKLLIKSTFESIINSRRNKPAELLARYLDKKLKGEKGVSDADIELSLDKCLKLFRYLQEKDIFEAFYKKILSKRLLLGKSANFDTEKSMIAKLKAECGANYTSKLEGMFQDIELSRDVMSAYMQHMNAAKESSSSHPNSINPAISSSLATTSSKPLQYKPEGLGLNGTHTEVGTIDLPVSSISKRYSSVEFQAQILTTGFWPIPSHSEGIIVPSEFQSMQDDFTEFYTRKYQGRRLVWAHSHERCVLTARFPKGKKELEVSYFQAIVLMAFSGADELSFSEIRASTRIEDDELKRTLQSLACGIIGTRVLIKEPKGKEVSESDKFVFNSEFSSKLYRIKINTIQVKESVEEVERTHEEVFRERQYQVDAAIVRIMKARKTLSHASLLVELMTQIKFPAKTSDMKKRIESLIEREYLTRDKDDPSLYVYLA